MKKYFAVIMMICVLAVTGCGTQSTSSTNSSSANSSSASVNSTSGTGSSGESTSTKQVCTHCAGTGKETCTYCDGKGENVIAGVTVKCSCKGTGEMRCLHCLGKGYIVKKDTSPNNNIPSTADNIPSTLDIPDSNGLSMKCLTCGGSGKKICPSCDGTGHLSRTHYSTNYGYGSSTYETQTRCYACRGNGRVYCTSCGGDGKY